MPSVLVLPVRTFGEKIEGIQEQTFPRSRRNTLQSSFEEVWKKPITGPGTSDVQWPTAQSADSDLLRALHKSVLSISTFDHRLLLLKPATRRSTS